MRRTIAVRQLRNFGLMVGGLFAVLGLWPAVFRNAPPRLWALVLAGTLGLPALIFPQSLELVYRVWMALGHGLGWLNIRILLSVIFYGLFTPLGFVMRRLGKEPLHLQFEPGAETYRLVRQARPVNHLIRQF